jgi:hypothetical protein
MEAFTMSRLSPQARRIVALSRCADDPSGADQHRVELALAQKLGAGVTTTFVSGGGTKSAAAMAGFGKGTVLVSACIALAAAMTQPRAMKVNSAAAPFTSSPAPFKTLEQSLLHQRDMGVVAPALAEASSKASRVSPPAQVEQSAAPDRALFRRAAGTSYPAAAAESGSGTKIVNPGTAALGVTNLDPLLAETAALREAQGALHSGTPARAIALIDVQDTVYSAGKLRQERAAVRVYALCALGHVARARTEAQLFARRWPRSPMLSRVRAACYSP